MMFVSDIDIADPPPGPCDFKESNVESLAAEVLRMALERLRGCKWELTQAAAQRLKSAHIRIGETGPVLSGGAFLCCGSDGS